MLLRYSRRSAAGAASDFKPSSIQTDGGAGTESRGLQEEDEISGAPVHNRQRSDSLDCHSFKFSSEMYLCGKT